MIPVVEAAAVYERERCARSFKEDVEAHLWRGYVINTPEVFCLARPVRRDGDPAAIVNPWIVFDAPDCWHLYLAAGDMRRIWDFQPVHLPWVSFERRNKLRFWRNDRIRERVEMETRGKTWNENHVARAGKMVGR